MLTALRKHAKRYVKYGREHLLRNMKRAEAESYFDLGDIEKGDERFKEIINEYPKL